ncbi:MAG: glutamate racemase [Myxococcales bacterium]|nr:glutamate racemase [Myxococcales bacterium]
MIGVFDSGVGGLTVVRAMRELLPSETILYLGDTARVPYGNKSPETVRRYAREALGFLQKAAYELRLRQQSLESWQPHAKTPDSPAFPTVDGRLKLVVVACNTVSAVALPDLRARSEVPVVGVIRPAVKRAVQVTKCQEVAVWGTEGTIRSHAYQHVLAEVAPHVKSLALPCPLLVPLIEEGWLQHDVTKSVLQIYLDQLPTKTWDTLILGCTHYPLLRPMLSALLPPSCSLVDSAQTTAEEVLTLLQKRGWLAPTEQSGELLCFVTDSADRFRRVATQFLGQEPQSVDQIEMTAFQQSLPKGGF